MNSSKIVFLCGARDYHALDWYKSAKLLLKNFKVEIVTDLLSAEGLNSLTSSDDKVFKLFIIDRFLFKKQSRFGNIWRNFVKFCVLPLQVIKLKSYYRENSGAIFHAHGMYFMFLAASANVPYVGTPQGSEILVRPQKSKFYKLFAKVALNNAKAISVDSNSMRLKMVEYFEINPYLIQNGIDLKAINEAKSQLDINSMRNRYTSIRGVSSLYRIHEISSNLINLNIKLTLLYPFFDKIYHKELIDKLECNKIIFDDLGRLNRSELYRVLFQSKVVFSFPESDSSPRSVYEAIFCGAIVLITYQKYYDDLPKCMKDRIILVDLNDHKSVKNAILLSEKLLKDDYMPSFVAIEMFDQYQTFLSMASKLYLI